VRILAAACILVGGCALLEPPRKTTALGAAEIRSAQAASNAIAIGKSTKADVRAALGEAIVVDFQSGYEVWVYRERPGEKRKPPATAPATELVLLFDSSGTLTKTRIR
jgi:hypothetical protein